MTFSLTTFWSRLTGNVHPEDRATFDRFPGHGFNLDFPPPAFVGDVENAPVLILDNNGGYDAVVTPLEFPDTEAHEAFRGRLAASQPAVPGLPGTAPYYHSRNYSDWLRNGQAALVNGVAYRSVDGRKRHVARLTSELPWARFHRHWLTDEVLPQVRRGDRFVVVHRWTRWGSAVQGLRDTPFAVFSRAPVSPDLTAREMVAAREFLAGRSLR